MSVLNKLIIMNNLSITEHYLHVKMLPYFKTQPNRHQIFPVEKVCKSSGKKNSGLHHKRVSKSVSSDPRTVFAQLLFMHFICIIYYLYIAPVRLAWTNTPAEVLLCHRATWRNCGRRIMPRNILCLNWQMGHRWVNEYIINEEILIILPAAIKLKQTRVSKHRLVNIHAQ